MLNATMKKTICTRIADRLKKEGLEPNPENVREAFFFLQPICIPDGFRVDHAGYRDIERGIRISVSRRLGDNKREEVEVAEEQEKEDLLAKVIETNKALAEQFIVLQKQVAHLTDVIKEFAERGVSKVPESLLQPAASAASEPPASQPEEKDENIHVGTVRQEDIQRHSEKFGSHRSAHMRTPQYGGSRRMTVEGRRGEDVTRPPEGMDLNRNPSLNHPGGNGMKPKITPIIPTLPKTPKPRPVETPTPAKCHKELEAGKPTVFFMGVPYNMRPEVGRLAVVFEARFVDSDFSVSVLEKKLKQTKSAAVQLGRLGLKELSMSKAAKDAACFYVQDERPATPESIADVIKKVEAHFRGCVA